MLFSLEWDAKFPLTSLVAETQIGSDHAPLILDSGDESIVRSNRFFFETGWMVVDGFRERTTEVWLNLLNRPNRHRDPLDLWNFLADGLRRFLTGWGANLGSETCRNKEAILRQIQELNRVADASSLDNDGWALRYHLEDELVQIFQVKEEYWHQRSRVKWTLCGDANTAYFHAVGNGRRRKCAIKVLMGEHGPITEKLAIQDHIYRFYRELMGTKVPQMLSI